MSLPPQPLNTNSNDAQGNTTLIWSGYQQAIANAVGTFAPGLAPYIINTPNAQLPNAQVLNQLQTGFVKVAITSGLLSSTGHSTIQTSDLSTTGVAAGTYTINGSTFAVIGVDGRITSASNLTIGAAPTGTAGGDLGGTYPNPTVLSVADITTGVLPVLNGGTGVTTKTGTGSVVLSTSPTLVTPLLGTVTSGNISACTSTSMVMVTPLLGTPTSGVLTNCSGTAASLTAGTVTTNANLTGTVTSVGNATSIANGAISNAMLANSAVANLSGTNTGDQTNISGNAATVTTNANLTGPITSSGNATSIASQTGTGTKFVVDTSPTIKTSTLTLPTITDTTDTTKAIAFTLSGATTAKTLTVSSSHTLARTQTLQDITDTFVYKTTTDTLTNKTLTSPTMTSPALGTVASGIISACTSTSMVMVTPVLGTPTSGTLINCTGYTDANLSLSDITTNNASTSNHGFQKKLNNNATTYMDGTGNYSTPAGSGTVNSGTTGQVAYYASSTSAVTGGLLQNVSGVTSGTAASAGFIGEIISSSIVYASKVAMTTATAKNITSITLTAGKWFVWGNIYVEEDAVSLLNCYAWISSTSATRPDKSLYAGSEWTSNPIALVCPNVHFNVSGSTTVYLGGYATASSGNITGCGNIYALRVG